MKCNRWNVYVYLFGLSVVLLSGPFFCVEAQEVSGQEIHIGALLPLSGGSQSAGNDMVIGLNLAREHMEYYLEKHGLTLNIDIRDSQGNPETALAILEEFKAEGIRVVIGPYLSYVANGVAEYAAENDLLLLSPGSTAFSLAKPDNLFRLCPNDGHQAKALALLMDQQNIETVIPVYVNDQYGADLQAAFRSEFTAQGGTVLDGVAYPYETSDFTEYAAQLEAAAVPYSATGDIETTAVLLAAHTQDGLDLLSAVPSDSVLGEMRWFASEALAGNADVANNEAAAQFAAKTGLSGFAYGMEGKDFYVYAHLIMQEAEEAAGKKTRMMVLMAFDALWLAVETSRTAPLADFESFKNEFLHIAEKTFSAYGFCGFDEDGDRMMVRYSLKELRGTPAEGYRWKHTGSYIDETYAPPRLSIDDESVLPVDADPVNISVGALLPLTGELSGRGAEARAAVNLAEEHINTYFESKGMGLRVDVAEADTKSTPSGALEAVQELYGQGARIFVGPLSSSEITGIADYVSETGISLISPSSTDPSLAIEDHIMRLVTSDIHQINGMSLLLNYHGLDQVFLVYRDDSFGDDIAASFQEILGDRVKGAFFYDPGIADFSSLLASMEEAVNAAAADAGAERIAVVTYGFEETIDLLGQVSPGGTLARVKWFGDDALALNHDLLANEQAAFIADQTELTCAIYDFAGFGLFLPQLESMNAYLAETTGEPATVFTVNTYDALWLAARAYEEMGAEVDLDTLWRALEREANFTYGMSTPTFLDLNGDRVTSAYGFYRVQADDAGNAEWELAALYSNAGFVDSELIVYIDGEPVTSVDQWEIF